MYLDIARNPNSTAKALNKSIRTYKKIDRLHGQALLLNGALTAEMLHILIAKVPPDMLPLAARHPHLSLEDQVALIRHSTDLLAHRVKSAILNKKKPSKEVLSMLSIDSDKDIREKAVNLLELHYGKENSNRNYC